MATCPIVFSFYYLARPSIHNVACEFACVERVRRNNRGLKQRRRRRQGRRLVKNEVIFYKRNSRLSRSAWYANASENELKLSMQRRCSIPNGNTKNKPSSSTFPRRRRTWSFHVVVLQRTAKKCTKIYNARAQLLFCSLNLLFSDVLVDVVVVACLSSLISLNVAEQWLCTCVITLGIFHSNSCKTTT